MCLVSQLLSKVTVTSCSFYTTLLLDDALKPVTPLTNGVIGETLRQFAHSVTLLYVFLFTIGMVA